MLPGCNQNHVLDTIPAETYPPGAMLRTYKAFETTTTHVPPLPIPGAVGCWSIRPDPAGLLRGDYDAALRAVANSAPPGWVLSAYHEASLVPGLTAAQAVRMQLYIHKIIHSVTDHLPFGNITLSGENPNWDAEGMDWYGVDVYDWNSDGAVVQHLNFWWNNKNAVGHRPRQTAPTLITEINSHIPAHRPLFFEHAYNWLVSPPAGGALLQFWNPTGKWSGPFLPGDAPTVKVLNEINAAALTNAPLPA